MRINFDVDVFTRVTIVFNSCHVRFWTSSTITI